MVYLNPDEHSQVLGTGVPEPGVPEPRVDVTGLAGQWFRVRLPNGVEGFTSESAFE